jgi:hypothetical protein
LRDRRHHPKNVSPWVDQLVAIVTMSAPPILEVAIAAGLRYRLRARREGVEGQAKRSGYMELVAQAAESHGQEEGWDSQEETSGFASFGRAEDTAWQFVCIT